jgi:hypothetical protein
MTVSPSFYFLSPRTLVVTKLEELARIEYGTWVFLLFYFCFIYGNLFPQNSPNLEKPILKYSNKD